MRRKHTYRLGAPQHLLGVCCLDHVVPEQTEGEVEVGPDDAVEGGQARHEEEHVLYPHRHVLGRPVYEASDLRLHF